MKKNNSSEKRPEHIPENVWNLVELCRDSFSSLYGDNVQGFVTATFKTETDKNIFSMAAIPLGKGKLYTKIPSDAKKKFYELVKEYSRKIDDVYYFRNLIKNANNYSHFLLEKLPFKFNEKGFWWENENEDIGKIEKLSALLRDNYKKEPELDENNRTIFEWKTCKYVKIDHYDNDFDVFFLPEDTSGLIFFPVPILSCVSLFFVLPNNVKNINCDQNIRWDKIYENTRYLIMNSIFDGVNKEMIRTKKKTPIGFLEEYIEKLTNLLLPLAYCISEKNCTYEESICYCNSYNDGDCKYINCEKPFNFSEKCSATERGKCEKGRIISVMREWQPCPYKFSDSNNKKYKLVVALKDIFPNDKTYYITFFLPTFVVPFAMGLIDIQDFPGYKTTEQSFENQVKANFKFLYENWDNKRKIKEQASRAAISQLFARTDAHDLGHVLDALNTVEGLSYNEIDGQYIYDGIHNNNLLSDNLMKNKLDKELYKGKGNLLLQKNDWYPELYAYFNRFLKTRMDFRADIATTDPNSLTTLEFYKDIFIPFNNNLIFNNRISGILDRDLKYKFTIIHDGKKNESIKLPVAIPNDILGCHALYIIMSNVIRNTIKHSNDIKNKNNLEFTIDIKNYTYSDMFYEVSIYSNVLGEEEIIKNLVNKRNISFHDSVLSDENILRDNALGTIEMDTCAAYLRKYEVCVVDDEKFDLFDNSDNFVGDVPIEDEAGHKIPRIMYAYSQKDENANAGYSLGYKFFLQKPKEVLIVHDSQILFSQDDRKILRKEGVDIIAISEMGKSSETFHHNFLVLANIGLEKIKNNPSNIPKRTLSMTIQDINIIKDYNNCINKANIIAFKKKCWEEWATQTLQTTISIKQHDDTEWFYSSGNNVSKSVVLHWHGETLTEQMLLQENQYNELRCGHHWAKKNIITNKKDFLTFKGKYPYQYIESVKTNIIIIDERIQKNIVLQGKKYGESILFSLYFEQLGIFIPSPPDENINKTISLLDVNSINKYKEKHVNDPDLNNANLFDIEEKQNLIKKYIDEKYKLNNNTFVVLHLGIIEKLIQDKEEKKNAMIIRKIIDGLVPEKILPTHVIITSGRGKPNNLDEKYSYISISSLQNAIETLFDKYRLVQILNNSRKSI